MKLLAWAIRSATVAAWTATGAVCGVAEAGKPSPPPEIAITPAGTYVHVDGNEGRFREDVWMGDGWQGGIEWFELEEKFGKDGRLRLEGRGIFDEEDYHLTMELVKPQVGFVRAGFTQYRRYFDGNGGYYKLFTPSKFTSPKELEMEAGKLFVEAGLTVPEVPRLTLGYEREYRDGKKSMLNWGSVVQTVTPPGGALPFGTVTKKIYPSYKDIHETVDVVRLDVEHAIGKIEWGNQFRYENYRNSTRRVDGAVNLNTSTRKNVSVKEDLQHDHFSTTFHMDSWCTEKSYWSVGYLFSTLHGGDGVSLNTLPYNAANDKNWFTEALTLRQDSHVVNLNLLLGPWSQFSTYGGVQAETTVTDGSASAVFTEFPDPLGGGDVGRLRSHQDKAGLEEILGARFTGIPFTTLYVEGRWGQQDHDLAEKQFENGGLIGTYAFKRFTETDVFRHQYTAGFNTSPSSRVTWAVKARHTLKDNHYDHEVDTVAGYPAHLKQQQFSTEELGTKLSIRAHPKIKVTVGYQLLLSDIESRYESIPFLGIPRGEVNSGNHDAHVYSVGLTLTPISRLYWTGQAFYTDARTISRDNHAHSVVTLHNNVYTLMTAVGIALSKQADLALDYSYSRADNFDNNGYDKTPKAGYFNSDYGLPLGADNERMAASATLTARFGKNVVGRLRYGFYQLRDNTTGGMDNYGAHLASASCSVRF